MRRQELHAIYLFLLSLKQDFKFISTLLSALRCKKYFGRAVHLAKNIQVVTFQRFECKSRFQVHLLCSPLPITLEIQSDLYIYEANQTLVRLVRLLFYSSFSFWKNLKQFNPFLSLVLVLPNIPHFNIQYLKNLGAKEYCRFAFYKFLSE